MTSNKYTELKQKKMIVSSLLATDMYESEECTISLTLSVRPFVHVMNQRNLISAKHSKNRGHENKIGVFSCFLRKKKKKKKKKKKTLLALHFEEHFLVSFSGKTNKMSVRPAKTKF